MVTNDSLAAKHVEKKFFSTVFMDSIAPYNYSDFGELYHTEKFKEWLMNYLK